MTRWSWVFLAAEGAQRQSSTLSLLLAFLIPFLFFYLLVWRPQQQQQRRRTQMLNSLKKGDRVVTVGGIHGEITAIKDDTLAVRIADRVEVRMNRSGVAYVKGKEEG